MHFCHIYLAKKERNVGNVDACVIVRQLTFWVELEKKICVKGKN